MKNQLILTDALVCKSAQSFADILTLVKKKATIKVMAKKTIISQIALKFELEWEDLS